MVTQIESMKYAVLALGLWFASAQGFAAQACCSAMPSTNKAGCGSCGGESDRETSPRPDCCTSMEAQKDVDVVLTSNPLPENPAVVEVLPGTAGIAPWQPNATDRIARQVSFRAQSPPLYLRYKVLLI